MSKISNILAIECCVILLLGIMTIFITTSKAYADKKLSLQVNLEPKFAIQKDLTNIAKEIEETAGAYTTFSQKAYWINEAKQSFQKFMYSYGYYSSSIEVETSDKNDNILIFNIEAGDRYKISQISFVNAANSNVNIVLPKISDLKIKPGNLVLAKNILNVQENILHFLDKNNCLLDAGVSHEVILNNLESSVEINFIINAGPAATIEQINFTGLKKTKEQYARKLVKLQQGQCFKRSYIHEVKNDLQKTGLFSTINVQVPKQVNANYSVPVTFEVTERKPRSLKAGLNYSTDFGVGWALGWQHRNFFGEGEEVKTDLFGNQKEQFLGLGYTKPFFRRDDQTLSLDSKFENKKSKAFNSKEARISGMLERQFLPQWKWGAGTGLSYTILGTIEQKSDKKKYALASAPLFIAHNTRDNFLNPHKGYEIKLDVTPFFKIEQGESFFKTQLSGYDYYSFKNIKTKPTIALKATIGSILGEKSINVPKPEKFYAGGANSVRGYGQQLVGTLDSKNSPSGGKSLVETSIELRLNLTEDIGMVGFVDSGFAYKSPEPKFDKALLHGAGIGIRYFTSFGPLRADIAFPLKRRKFIDRTYQIYFGIGQSF